MCYLSPPKEQKKADCMLLCLPRLDLIQSWQIWDLQFLHSAYTNFVMYYSRDAEMEIDMDFHMIIFVCCQVDVVG